MLSSAYDFQIRRTLEVNKEIFWISYEGNVGERGGTISVKHGFWAIWANHGDSCVERDGKIVQEKSPKGPLVFGEWWVDYSTWEYCKMKVKHIFLLWVLRIKFQRKNMGARDPGGFWKIY